ncbi:peroxiredoxin [Myxococcus sp. MISCRS1]|uniref:peroxiredoxin n=1 Tax=Myxococcus TaxID=32 RepID=UPI001CBD74ED|nr:peroxiredoxin [Myxococcus sp. MISCRS1]MBZ4396179.1 peroxiredoxin [Myxococcus sp. AS-1-15]MBZ4408710.1 peroxiredoxin [Myxococcus sp. XM-1-1-1]MCY1000768.1 peroxiredoxin [Myxococcus sp. MISCRS1]BDT37684.1 peroxiredoxin [Myxococcus sp. MH1]
MAKNKLLKQGDVLPDVTLTGAGNQPVRLKDLVGQKVLVVYFYPRDDSPGCTVQACGLRDQYEDFVAAGAEVVGISGDSVASHQGFAAKHRLPFVLLSDEKGQAREAFGVGASFLGMLPGRVTFVVDRQGIVQDSFESQLRVGEHVRRALELVRSLASKSAASP